jgi:hypothetical protein
MAIHDGVDMATMTSIGIFQKFIWHFKMLWSALSKRIGALTLALWLALISIFLVLTVLLYVQAGHMKREEERSTVAQSMPSSRPVIAVGSANELERFQAYLLPHEDIPEVLSLMIGLAANEGLQLAKGEYKIQVDARGKFVRYRMSFPVQGDATKIEQFIHKALAQHKTLALEAVQFKRERIDAAAVEAKMDWVLMTKLPKRFEGALKSDGAVEVKP